MKSFMRMALGAAVICVGSVASAAVYKSVDAEGHVVYSDAPSKNAQEINLPPISIVPSLSATDLARANEVKDNKQQVEITQYQLSFISPLADQVVRKPEAVQVTVQSKPELSNNDRMSILLDGVVVAEGNSVVISTESLDRGAHSLAVRVTNQAGQVISQIDSSLNIQQTTVNSPANKKRKAL